MRIVVLFALMALAKEVKLSCPSGASDIALECCLDSKSTKGHCFHHGPSFTYHSTVKYREKNYLNNKLNGKYIEWNRDESSVRVEGSYIDDHPEGEWSFNNFKDGKAARITYKNGLLSGLNLPEVYNYQHFHEADDFISGEPIVGIVRQESLSPNFEDDPFDKDVKNNNYTLLYRDKMKKEISGIAISNYRFFYKNVYTSLCEEPDGNGKEDNIKKWDVVERIEATNMCRSPLGSEGGCGPGSGKMVWFSCEKFIGIVDYYKSGYVSIPTSAKFFLTPGGKRISPPEGNIGPVSVIFNESKVIDKQLWVKISFRKRGHECEGEPDTKGLSGSAWVKFYDNGKTVFNRAPDC